jgi:hypothetical protein
MWLADKAQSLHHLPPMSIATTQFRKFWDDPGFKVVEEWGTWRDSIERVDARQDAHEDAEGQGQKGMLTLSEAKRIRIQAGPSRLIWWRAQARYWLERLKRV